MDPEVILKRLLAKQEHRVGTLRTLESYYEGDHPLAFASLAFRKAFGNLFGPFADNWCQTVVTATEERLKVDGFRFGPGDDTDSRAWEIWQANQLDSESKLAHTEALVCGESYALVWPTPDGPRVTVEHPLQVIASHDPANRRRTTAAAKVYQDDDGVWVAYLYTPDFVYRFRAEGQIHSGIPGKWVPEDREGTEDPAVQPNPLGPVVPVVRIPNRPRMIAPPRSEIASVIPLQDAINKLCADMMVTSERTSDSQRYVLGWEGAVDPETNQPKNMPFNPRDPLWVIGDPEDGGQVRVGQFQAGDITGFIKAIEMFVQHIASQTRTPPHYLAPGADRLSGESIKSSESGLVSKVRDKQVVLGEAWEQVMRLCLRLDGASDRASYVGAETVWADPEIRSEAQAADAALKRKELGVPERQLWEDLRYSPTQIERFEVERLSQEFFPAG